MAESSLLTRLFRALGKPVPEGAQVSSGLGLDERMTRRRASVDQAVAEAMTGAGILSSGYRHETRAVDPRSHQFVVTIDLPKELASMTAGSLAQIGATINRKVKVSHAAELIGVYWRAEHDAEIKNQESVNVPRTTLTRSAALQPELPVVSASPSTPAPASDRVAKLREMMKDEAEGESDQGFANTVIGFEGSDKPGNKR